MWYVGPTPGKREGHLKNPTKSQSLPLVIWKYFRLHMSDEVAQSDLEERPETDLREKDEYFEL